MHDIQDFYHQQMKKSGFRSTQKMPLELANGKLVIHDELAGSETETVKLNVTGVRKLELIAEPTTKVIGGAGTIWAAPKLSR
jgi:hypothetical protein